LRSILHRRLITVSAVTAVSVGTLAYSQGRLSFASGAKAAAPPSAATPSAGLDAKEFKPFKVVDIQPYNHNTRQYKIKVEGHQEVPVASFVMARANIDSKEVARPYTPIKSKTPNEMNLLIKTYPTGVMSKHMGSLKVGDSIDLKGPVVKYGYKANMKKEIGMIAGGTGITPMLQVLNKIVEDPADKTRVSLVFCNTTEDDILLKEQLDALTAKNKNISVTYVVDNPKGKWQGEKGLISEDLVKKKMPKPGPDSLVLVCGPPGFMVAVSGNKAKDYTQGDLTGILAKLGYNKDGVFKY